MNWRTRHAARPPGEHARGAGVEPPLAAHLASTRGLYTHHGLYVGDGRVIHYAGPFRALFRGKVEEVSLKDFARGRRIAVLSGATPFTDAEVVRRARLRLGERRYRLLSNNCEHFCEWCLRGRSRSSQVERLHRLLRLRRPVSPVVNNRTGPSTGGAHGGYRVSGLLCVRQAPTRYVGTSHAWRGVKLLALACVAAIRVAFADPAVDEPRPCTVVSPQEAETIANLLYEKEEYQHAGECYQAAGNLERANVAFTKAVAPRGAAAARAFADQADTAKTLFEGVRRAFRNKP
jgi:Lecithin retinol acyltransferase